MPQPKTQSFAVPEGRAVEVKHDLGTMDLVVQLWEVVGSSAGPRRLAAADLQLIDPDTVYVEFEVRRPQSEYVLVVVPAVIFGAS